MPTKTNVKSGEGSKAQGVADLQRAAQSPLAAKTLRHLQTASPAASRASAPPSSTGVSSAAAAMSSPAQDDNAEASTATLVARSTSASSISQPMEKASFSRQQQNPRRATTSSPLPPDLLGASQAAGQEAPPTLATEILPAPPALPYDPSYPPLNPQAATGLLSFPLAATPSAPRAASGRPGLDVLVNGQPSASEHAAAPPYPVPHTSAQDKKRKQPVYSLATPEGYEGVMPWALYAIVNGKAEALDRKGGKSRRRRVGGKAASAAYDGRNSRTATPEVTAPPPARAPTQGAADDRPQSVLPIDSARAGDVLMADAVAVPLESTKIDAGMVNGDVPHQELSAQDGQAVDAMPVTAISPSTDPIITSSDPIEDDGAAQAPRMPAKDHGAALAPTAQSSDGQKSDRDLAQASRLDQLPNTSAIAPSTLEGEMASSGPQDNDKAMVKDGDSAQADGGSSGQAPTGKRATATKKRRSTHTTKAPVITTDGTTTPSRASSVSRGEGSVTGGVTTPHRTAATLLPEEVSGPSRDVLALASSPTLASLSGSGARPTRAAVAKVAARGSYYDTSAYEVQSPLQTAAVKNLQTTPRSTSANRRVNGSTSKTVATSASSLTGTPTPSSRAANGKGKEKEVDSTVDVKQGFDEAPLNEDFCSTCRGTGHFICCDSCPRSFHFACVNPPLDINEVPLDDNSEWHCRACSAQRRSSSQGTQKKGSAKQERSSARGGRFFAPLADQVEGSNPSIFTLPPDIKSFFKNVASAVDGSYQDIGRQRAIKADRKGLMEERDPYRLKDAKGKEIMCYHCGQSALPKAWNPSHDGDATPSLSWRPLVSCDHCSLHWHLDCLDPPLASVPSSLYKWRCPCHIEDLLVKTRTAKAATQLQIVDLPVPTLLNTGFGPGKIYRPRVLNSGVIDIVPDPMDTYFSAASSSDTSGRALQPGWMNGGRADVPPLVDGEIPGGGMRRVKFRLPEKVVRTDWWMKVLHGGRDALLSGEKRGVNAMDLLASIATDELEHQGEARDLVHLALTGSQAPSLRVQPMASYKKPQDPPRRGFVPHPGGKLKREEDEQWAESAMRGSLHLVDDEEGGPVAGKARTNGGAQSAAPSSAAVPSSSSESDLTDLSEDEGKGKPTSSDAAVDDAATPRSGKRIKLVHASETPAPSSLSQEEMNSLLAVRELMKKKGEGELMKFLMAE